jgi:hypothetical protein
VSGELPVGAEAIRKNLQQHDPNGKGMAVTNSKIVFAMQINLICPYTL